MDLNETNPCKECGVLHENPNDHEFIYTDSNDILNKRGLVDSLTLQPFYEPIELNCGHTFSKSSIEEAFRNKKECPMCRKRTSKINETNQIIKNQVNDLEVKCPNQCDLKIERQFLKTHLLDCPKLKKNCLNKCDDKKCDFVGIKTEMDEHIKVCELRTITCNGIGQCSIVALHLEEHNCFTDLIKKVSTVINHTSQIHKLEINSLKNALNTQGQIINQQKLRIEQHTDYIKKYQDEIKLLHNNTSIQNSLLQSQKKTIEAQEYKIKYFDKRLSTLEIVSSKTNFCKVLSASSPSIPVSSFSSLSNDVFGKDLNLMNIPKKIYTNESKCVNTIDKSTYDFGFSKYAPLNKKNEDNKDLPSKNLSSDADADADTGIKLNTLYVENKTTLSTNDRKRKAEDDNVNE